RPGTEAGRWLDFLPVCLNSILYSRELDLEGAFVRLGDFARARYWECVAAEAGRGPRFLPVCPNSILYSRELDLEWAFVRLGDFDRARYWESVAAERAAVMREVFWDAEKEFFLDFDWKVEERSPVPSIAGFYPLWAGWATPE